MIVTVFLVLSNKILAQKDSDNSSSIDLILTNIPYSSQFIRVIETEVSNFAFNDLKEHEKTPTYNFKI